MDLDEIEGAQLLLDACSETLQTFSFCPDDLFESCKWFHKGGNTYGTVVDCMTWRRQLSSRPNIFSRVILSSDFCRFESRPSCRVLAYSSRFSFPLSHLPYSEIVAVFF